jgi:hypothetical protein
MAAAFLRRSRQAARVAPPVNHASPQQKISNPSNHFPQPTTLSPPTTRLPS